jgi:acetyl-CoA acetyltransferase
MSKLREVFIAGTGITKFDRCDGEKGRPLRHFPDLGAEAIIKALAEAEMKWKEIEGAFCGSVYCGTGAGHQVIQQIGLTGIPIVNVENACSSGISALRLGYELIGAGVYDVLMIAGFEQMPRGPIQSTAWPEWQRKLGFNVLPALYAMETRRYMEDTGATEHDFAMVTVKNRKNGALNKNARLQKEVTIEEVLSSPTIASPLRFLNACPLADGGSAVILCSKSKLKNKSKAVAVATAVLTSGTYRSPNKKSLDLTEISAKQAYEASGFGPEDIQVVQAYDTMSPGELWDLEKLGFCKLGQAPELLREGYFDLNGKLPVNTDGGLMSRGHPLGATALAQVIEIYRQLRNEAGPRQVTGAKIGLAHAMGSGPNSGIVILKS